jgi:hypothetical protein
MDIRRPGARCDTACTAIRVSLESDQQWKIHGCSRYLRRLLDGGNENGAGQHQTQLDRRGVRGQQINPRVGRYVAVYAARRCKLGN